jgi:hypothetical protein
MHLQVKTKVPNSSMTINGHDGDEIAVSATYEAGALAELLTVLKGANFNLRAAGGSKVEMGGEFSFWVDGRSDSEDHDKAAYAARDLLRKHHYEADVYEVHARHLSDESGTLLDFVNEVTKGELLVEAISVGTKDDEGIPVQIFTASVALRE